MPWGLAAAAVGAIGGAVISGDASKSAAQTQANAAQSANNTQLQMFNTTQQNLAPYMTSGKNNLANLNALTPQLTTPFSATQYQQSPGYAWQMSQGIDAVQNSASAAGGIGGGNTLKALTQYGQGLANTDYQQAYNNYMGQQQQTYNMYSGLANSGQSAAAGLGGISAGVGQSVGNNITSAGAAQAGGTIGSANALSGGITQLANLYGSGAMGFGTGGVSAGYGGLNSSPSGFGTQGGYILNNGVSYCDYVIKKNIEPFWYDRAADLQVYEFHFKGERDTDPKRRGFIAQEVREKYPEAVSRGPKGFLLVDYDRVPSDEEWRALDKLSDGMFA